MKRRHVPGWILALVALASCRSEEAPKRVTTGNDSLRTAAAIDTMRVDSTGVGPLRLGMTIAEAQRVLPGWTFERTSDGDGAALVSVTRGVELMVLWAGEDDAAVPVDTTERVRVIEVFTRGFRTADGVGVESLVADVERLHGPVVTIVRSEIESREYVTFERQPGGIVFRIHYKGVFAPDSNRTRRYAPDARIFSMAAVGFD